MFVKSDIEKCLEAYRKEERVFEKLIFYPSDALQRTSEEFIASVIGTKTEFEDVKLFWVKAFQQILEKTYFLEEWEKWGKEHNSMFLMDAKPIIAE